MGEHRVNSITKLTKVEFVRNLLDDIKALELMLKNNQIESDIVRIGSEQEFCLVTKDWRPSKDGPDILSAINDNHFTTELAKFNLEINLDPIELKAACFSEMKKQLDSLLEKAKKTAKKFDTKIVLTGILPTISKNEIENEYMTPIRRYEVLNKTIKKLKGADLDFHIQGVDNLSILHDSVLFEACNTSFQMHLQIAPEDFISSYNWAQAISGPLLGISTNSPLLLGRELWSETRIALFKQSIDTRSLTNALSNQQARVSFSNSWETGSVLDVFKNDIAQYKTILSKKIECNSLEELEQGKVPKLKALCLNNGSIYRWNRPCYGISNGKAHLRIENRYIPSGPSTLDEMANFAFWVGLMKGRPKKFDDMPNQMDFRDARSNFIKAAKTGKESMLTWNGKLFPLPELILKEFLPIAYEGLNKMKIDKEDIDQLLGVIEKRTHGLNGAQWSIKNYRRLIKTMKQDEALRTLTKSMYINQESGLPIHDWKDSKVNLDKEMTLVEHIMSTQLFKVNESDVSDLAISIMKWKNIHHVPVEDNDGQLCGILTWQHVKSYKSEKERMNRVSKIMTTDVITIGSNTKISTAIDLMKKHKIGCLPVLYDNQLVGIITKKDVMRFGKG